MRDFAIARDQFAGRYAHHVALAQIARRDAFDAIADDQFGQRFGPRLAQRVGLRLAAPFGHGLSKICEEHREPQPDRNREIESGRPVTSKVAHEEEQGDKRADFADEHHRIAKLPARIEFRERVDHRSAENFSVEQGACFRTTLDPSLRDHLKRFSLQIEQMLDDRSERVGREKD